MPAEGIAYKTLTQAQVSEMCDRHERLWSGRSGGARAHFAYCILTDMDLSRRDLSDADFTGAILTGANLSGTVLNSSSLYSADLRRANLEGASLRRADLRGAVLRGAVLTGADMTETDLREGVIARPDRERGLAVIKHETRAGEANEANFTGANLTRSKMAGMVAQRADFTDAMLLGARLIRLLADPDNGLVLNAWLNADGALKGDAGGIVR